MAEMSGLFLVFDGIDGAGKTTQVRLLERALTALGHSVLVSKEPTSGPWGQKIRVSASEGRMALEEELEAFIRDREAHLEELIVPALAEGRLVILDRYFYSTIAYQGARGGDVANLNERVRKLALEPDMTFILDVDEHVATARILERDGNVNEFERSDTLRKVRLIYQTLTELDARTYLIDGMQAVGRVAADITYRLTDEAAPVRSKLCEIVGGCEDAFYCTYRMTNACRWWNMRVALRSWIDDEFSPTSGARLMGDPG